MNSTPVEFARLVMRGADHMVAGDANDAFNDAVFGFIDKQVDYAGTARAAVRG